MKRDIEEQTKTDISIFLYKHTQRKDTEMAWFGIGVPVVRCLAESRNSKRG